MYLSHWNRTVAVISFALIYSTSSFACISTDRYSRKKILSGSILTAREGYPGDYLNACESPNDYYCTMTHDVGTLASLRGHIDPIPLWRIAMLLLARFSIAQRRTTATFVDPPTSYFLVGSLLRARPTATIAYNRSPSPSSYANVYTQVHPGTFWCKIAKARFFSSSFFVICGG